MFNDKRWKGEVGHVYGMHLEGTPVSEAYDMLADWIEDHPDIQRQMEITLAAKDFTQLRKEREKAAKDNNDLEIANGYIQQAFPGLPEILPKLPRVVEVAPNRTKGLRELRYSDVVKVLNIVDNRGKGMIDGGHEYLRDQHRKWDPILAALPVDDSKTIAEIIDNRPDEEYGS